MKEPLKQELKQRIIRAFKPINWDLTIPRHLMTITYGRVSDDINYAEMLLCYSWQKSSCKKNAQGLADLRRAWIQECYPIKKA
jgi:hypothetical protein